MKQKGWIWRDRRQEYEEMEGIYIYNWKTNVDQPRGKEIPKRMREESRR